jgi:hypothetical protein
MTKYYVRTGQSDQTFGPLDSVELRDMAEKGMLSPDDRVSIDQKEWVEASRVLDQIGAAVASRSSAEVASSGEPQNRRSYLVLALMKLRVTSLLVALVLVGGGIFYLAYDPDYTDLYGPGVVAPDVPAQTRPDDPEPFTFKGFQLRPIADFSLTARILSYKRYSSDEESQLSPLDLALGWGRMSDASILKNISISQSRRFYYWKTPAFPIPRKEIEHCSANMHLIPANDKVKAAMRRVGRGKIVKIDGILVNVARRDGWKWISSRTRRDVGYGACEVIFVKVLEVIEPQD